MQAIEDGVLVPFVAGRRDTGHRITRTAWEELKEHYRSRGYSGYSDRQFHDFFFAELLPLAPFASREYQRGGILKSDYDFRVSNKPPEAETLWYLPNENAGITIMKPEDY